MKGLIDSHFHLINMRAKGVQIEPLLKQLFSLGWYGGIDVASSITDTNERVALVKEYPTISIASGIGAWGAQETEEISTLINLFRDSFKVEEVDFIGEIGLDFHWNYGTAERQKELFQTQIELASSLKKPIIVHSRQADSLMIETLKESPPTYGGIMHCYSSGWELLECAVEMGLFISFAGPITYPSNKSLREMVKEVPLEQLLLETDSPYLSPVPLRGKVNTPLTMSYIYKEAASIKNIEEQEFVNQIKTNYQRLCNLSPKGSL